MTTKASLILLYIHYLAEQQYDFSRMGEAADNGIWGYNHPADFAVQPYNMNGLHCHSAYENQTGECSAL